MASHRFSEGAVTLAISPALPARANRQLIKHEKPPARFDPDGRLASDLFRRFLLLPFHDDDPARYRDTWGDQHVQPGPAFMSPQGRDFVPGGFTVATLFRIDDLVPDVCRLAHLLFLSSLMGCMIAADAKDLARAQGGAVLSAQRYRRNSCCARKPVRASTQQNSEKPSLDGHAARARLASAKTTNMRRGATEDRELRMGAKLLAYVEIIRRESDWDTAEVYRGGPQKTAPTVYVGNGMAPICAWPNVFGPVGSSGDKTLGREEELTMDSELESFKTSIDLRAYAAAQGYQLDRKESWRGSAVMRIRAATRSSSSAMPTAIMSISRSRDDRDNGSIIDFVQHRQS